MTCFLLTEVLSTITAPVESTILVINAVGSIASASKTPIRGSPGQRLIRQFPIRLTPIPNICPILTVIAQIPESFCIPVETNFMKCPKQLADLNFEPNA